VVRFPLRYKFILWIAFLVTFIIITASLFSLYHITRILTDGLENPGTSLAAALSSMLPDAFKNKSAKELSQLAEHIVKASENVIEINVFDPGWKYIAHASKNGSPSREGEFLPREERAKYAAAKKASRIHYQQGENGFAEFGSLIKDEGGRFGFVSIKYSTEHFTREIDTAIKFIICLALISLFAGITLSVFMANFITRKLNMLIQRVELVARGDYSKQADITSSDEIGLLSARFNEMTQGLLEKTRIMRFVPENITTLVKNDSDFFKESGVERKVTVLFIDIRNFTGLSESNPPDEMIKMLNGYLEAMTEVIKRNGGVVDKFIGDAIMAVFYPDENCDDEIRAVTCAIQMTEELWHFNHVRETAGRFKIQVGIGINTGRVIAGMIGSSSGRLDYTVIGDAVNLASRLEGMSKNGKYTRIVVSEATFAAVKNIFDGELMQQDSVKGKKETVKMYEIIGLKDIDGLIAGLASRDEKDRYNSVSMIGLTGRPELIKNILPMINDGSHLVKMASVAALKNLMLMDFELVKLLFGVLENETDVRVISNFVLEIGLIGEDEDRERLVKYMDHEDPRVRANAIESIGYIKNRAFIAGVLEKKLSDPNNRNRANAAIRLYQLGDLAGLKTLLEMCRDASNYLMRASGAYGLGEITSKEQARVIAEKLESAGDYFSPGRLELLESARLTLENLLSDVENIVKVNAARALGRMGNPLSITALVNVIKTANPRDDVYQPALGALKELTSPNVFKQIERRFIDGIKD